jgi:hypothetical protein
MLEFKLDSPPSSSSGRLDESSPSSSSRRLDSPPSSSSSRRLHSPPSSSSSSRRLDESSHSRQHMIYDGESKALSDSKYCDANDREEIADGNDSGL